MIHGRDYSGTIKISYHTKNLAYRSSHISEDRKMSWQGVRLWKHQAYIQDRQIVLQFHTYVANRIQIIREHWSFQQWHYVSSNDNPDNQASHGDTKQQYVLGLGKVLNFSNPEIWMKTRQKLKHLMQKCRRSLQSKQPGKIRNQSNEINGACFIWSVHSAN